MGQVDYKAILDEAWQQHLAPRQLNAPTVISTFAGCGGSSLGYSMAGYRELLAVEWDDNAVATFKLNFSDVPVYHGDICKLTVNKCLELAGIKPGQLDVLDGSPPCQGFSTAGKRQMNDERNQLYHEFVRLLRELQPRVFVMENVSGLVKGKMKLVFADIMRELKASGYNVKCRLMNAMYFQVPQSRQRLIWIGVRKDSDRKPSHAKPQSKPILLTQIIQNVTRIRSYGAGYKIKWLNANRVHPTLQKDSSQKATRWLVSGIEHRPTTRELALISSFPSDMAFSGTWKNAWAEMGNSVPPLFMRAISQHIRTEILDQ